MARIRVLKKKSGRPRITLVRVRSSGKNKATVRFARGRTYKRVRRKIRLRLRRRK